MHLPTLKSKKPSRCLKALLLGISLLTLTACGGGTTPAPIFTPPTPAPTPPPPTPPPAPGQIEESDEYKENWGLDAIKPLTAYERGGTGEGIIVGIVDSGVDEDHVDLVGNIHSASKDVSFSRALFDRTIDDIDGHGTFVAGIIGAMQNDSGTLGVAYNSSLLILRADERTSCTDVPDDPEEEPSCIFSDPDIAKGIDFAVATGAKVINLSLGGNEASLILVQAIQGAVEAGVLMVISAGNDGEANPDAMALQGINPNFAGHIIIVGASDITNTIAGFSNKAGTGQTVYMVAPGDEVTSTYLNNHLGIGGGTSFAAPHVTGAAAILFQMFPSLTAPEVMDILLESATDLGAPGVDDIYGWGLLNIEAAIAPLGAQSLPIQVVGNSLSLLPIAPSGIDLSPAFGDALITSPLNSVMMLDGYNRSYMINMTNRIERPQAGINLGAVLAERHAYQALGLDIGDKGGFQVNLYDPNWQIRSIAAALPQSVSANLRHDVGYAHFTAKPTPNTEFSITKGMAWSNLGGGAKARRSFMSRGLFGESFLGFGTSKTQVGVVQNLSGSLDLKIGTSFGKYKPKAAQFFDKQNIKGSVTTAYTSLTHWGAKYSIGIQAGAMVEKNAMLGSLSDGALNLGSGANTIFTRVEGTVDLGSRFSLTGTFSHGWTKPEGMNPGFISNISHLRTMSFGAALLKESLFSSQDRLGFAIASPLRVESGKIGFTLPTNRDYTLDEILFSDFQTSLAPTKREMDFEISYKIKGFKRWTMEANILHQLNAGHSTLWGDVTTAALKMRTNF